MTDIALQFDPHTLTCDLALGGGDLVLDDGMTTAVIISLFSDARAESGDVIPDGTDNPRGWWADKATPLMAANGYRLGSKLWLLAREKQLPETKARAEAYARAALQWLIDDGFAVAIDVAVWFPTLAWMAITVAITAADGQTTTHQLQVPA